MVARFAVGCQHGVGPCQLQCGHRHAVAVCHRGMLGLVPILEVFQVTGRLTRESGLRGLTHPYRVIGSPKVLSRDREHHFHGADIAGLQQYFID